MPVSPLFIGGFIGLFIFCVIIGLLSHLPVCAQPTRVQLCTMLRGLTSGSFMVFCVTELCGLGGSNNSDFLVADALKNQALALQVTLKLIQKG